MARGFFTNNKKFCLFLGSLLCVIVVGWLLFCTIGYTFIDNVYYERLSPQLNSIIRGKSAYPVQHYYDLANKLIGGFLFNLPILVCFLLLIFRPTFLKSLLPWDKWFKKHTEDIDSIPAAQLGLWIVLAAAVGLYAELMIIRIHSSFFQLFAYFKNISLLSCFLGLCIGFARGNKKPLQTPVVLPMITMQILFLFNLRHSPIAKLLQNPVSEQLGMGISQITGLLTLFVTYGFLLFIFVVNMFCFIPLGHLVSRLMSKQDKLVSYSWNLIGSIAGVILFGVISFLWAPPILWLFICALGVMAFLYKDNKSIVISLLCIFLIVLFFSIPTQLDEYDIYSPYQTLTLRIDQGGRPIKIKTSNVYLQKILDLSKEEKKEHDTEASSKAYYDFPYVFKKNPNNVLIVGSGTGNDVSAALHNNAQRIDAVEIDPAIMGFGKAIHPEFPYQSEKVNAIVDDARAYFRKANSKYDIIVYALLDSHMLLSGRAGNMRLDSYVYTVESFQEAKNLLKSDGIICLSFSVLDENLGKKLYKMLAMAFDGKNPLVFRSSYDGSLTFIAGEAVTAQQYSSLNEVENITHEFLNDQSKVDISTDDWPFFYMPKRKYPKSYFMIFSILFLLSGFYVRKYMSVSGTEGGFSWPCFFLGAGFMLIETKGITELALIYGSTWFVISIVILAILIMAFFANLLVIKRKEPSSYVTYGLLFVAILIGYFFTYLHSVMSISLSRIVVPMIITLPLFFSGFAFSTELKKSSSIGVALSSNLLGAMLGGFLEYNSMYFGFRSLYIIALFTYVLAFASSVLALKRT
ncbi:MAG: hypothetical protein A2Y03_05195 [Omnitrophica WOR_2 bacterium GWF2_38_59]|nr:MAG: hypothetical protein A2Y03_05195 [Omnitrophica WOR_2 bacterium GWF2_38_59]OGX48223.1 MAG: hypothetical protein A2243_10095 [Omnitrophica WOR_2 bacterium RIFOXYA2_FULL_38_17]OGX53300.1 MAG: hypothetical protein A2267_02720 [Omnitrophica WOR_2 bacterium RIFOXYA12_FULL_38_10]OGX59612.1 MAG: hypothetical protein A2447_12205 [Omnitrophica WOR_2 bacterium RIFOXYC2_FULL_38_12]OGX60004.1 MAG: hypothetical protein A2306_04740 [Omnitrophica WOR_2 bacterium RIFOXYB2_FULL_38_16]